jgi:hypothetical protein
MVDRPSMTYTRHTPSTLTAVDKNRVTVTNTGSIAGQVSSDWSSRLSPLSQSQKTFELYFLEPKSGGFIIKYTAYAEKRKYDLSFA